MTVEISVDCALVFEKYRGFVEREKIVPQQCSALLHVVKLCNIAMF